MINKLSLSSEVLFDFFNQNSQFPLFSRRIERQKSKGCLFGSQSEESISAFRVPPPVRAAIKHEEWRDEFFTLTARYVYWYINVRVYNARLSIFFKVSASSDALYFLCFVSLLFEPLFSSFIFFKMRHFLLLSLAVSTLAVIAAAGKVLRLFFWNSKHFFSQKLEELSPAAREFLKKRDVRLNLYYF